MLDTDPQHFRLQPENAIQMEPWKGGSTDRDLVGMIPFLEGMLTAFRKCSLRANVVSSTCYLSGA